MPSRLGDGGRPLDGTPLVENWAAREGDGVDAFVLIGRRDGRLWYAPLLCLDQGAGLARVWDEWVRLGMPAQTAKVPLGKRVAAGPAGTGLRPSSVGPLSRRERA